MGARKRTPFQREEDLAKTARWYCQGLKQFEIAKYLGVTQQQISVDLKQIQKRWQDRAVEDFDTVKSRELAKIDELERVSWEAWTRSTQPKEVSQAKDVTGVRARKEQALRREAQVGDPRFLSSVQWCIDKRCRILGLEAPTQQNHLVARVSVNAGVEVRELESPERQAQLLAIFQQIGAPAALLAGTQETDPAKDIIVEAEELDPVEVASG